jgi:ParB family transcriptional regulator, chromosome partitioning protein
MDKTQVGVIVEIPVQQIIEPVDPMRSSFDEDKINELCESIKKQGLINPITVRPVHVPIKNTECSTSLKGEICSNPLHKKYEVVAGHRRFTACVRASVFVIPCVVREMTDDEVFSMRAHENLFREDVDPVDEALYIGKLIGEETDKIPEIAEQLNRSVTWVEDRLMILTYPDYFLQPIKVGKVKLGVAKALAQIDDEVYRKMFFDNAIRDGMTVWQADYFLSQWQNGIYKDSSEIVIPSDNPKNFEPVKVRMQCAKCGQMAETPNLQTVWIHVECPSDE